MRATNKWRTWCADLTAVRLRTMLQGIEDQEQFQGQLNEPDQFLKKLLIQEIDRRYA